MDITQLQSRISLLIEEEIAKPIEEEIPEPTLRRWAAEGIITKPKRHSKGKGGGRGRVSDWPDKAVEEATACWYIRRKKLTLPPSAEKLNEVKQIVKHLYESPLWNPYFAGERFPLVVFWTCTIEKIRQGRSIFDPALITFNWSTEELKKERDGKLTLKITIDEPDHITDSLTDHGQARFGIASNSSKQIGRFLGFIEEDQIVIRLDGINTMNMTSNGIVNILGAAGYDFSYETS